MLKNSLAVLMLGVALCGAGVVNAEDKVLSTKMQYLTRAACLEAQGDIHRLKEVFAQAIEHKVDLSSLKEAMSQLYAYTGFPRSLNATNALREVSEELAGKGVEVDEGKDAAPYPKDYDALKEGTAVQTKLSGKPFDYTFSPALNYYLKAHLFGDIFKRDTLTPAERELVTVSALSGLRGVPSQLKSHVRGALNMGVTQEQLDELAVLLADKVGRNEALRLRQAMGKEEGVPADALKFPLGQENVNYSKYFIGKSYLAPLASGEGKLPVHNVTFEPGCRNNWHIHHKGGQILICVSGRGWYQQEGMDPIELREGTVVDIPAEVKHWHGAAKDSYFQHIALGVPAEGASTTWLEAVSDEEYQKLP